jgi:hypothetical protein
MSGVTVWLPGLPASHDGSSIESIRLYVKNVSEFLSSPVARLICQCHPNHVALLSGPSTNIPPRGTFSSWWSYFDELGVKENHMPSVISAFPETSNDSASNVDVDPLKELVSSGTLPDGTLALKYRFHQYSHSRVMCIVCSRPHLTQRFLSGGRGIAA